MTQYIFKSILIPLIVFWMLILYAGNYGYVMVHIVRCYHNVEPDNNQLDKKKENRHDKDSELTMLLNNFKDNISR